MDLIAAIKTRLHDQVPALRQIDGAIELDAVINEKARVDSPAAFIVPLSDMPDRDESFTGRTIQRVESVFAVVFCVDSYRDELGAEAMQTLNVLRAAVRAALLGWVPEPQTGSPAQAGPGRFLDFKDGCAWWSDEYRITHYWSSER